MGGEDAHNDQVKQKQHDDKKPDLHVEAYGRDAEPSGVVPLASRRECCGILCKDTVVGSRHAVMEEIWTLSPPNFPPKD